jgi:hypothetical protein
MIGKCNQYGIMVMLPKSISFPKGFLLAIVPLNGGPASMATPLGASGLGNQGPLLVYETRTR